MLRAMLALTLLASPAAAAPFLVGTWFGVGEPGDKSEMFLARMAPDGSFHALFRACVKGKAFDETDSGSWSLAGDMEKIHVAIVNGLPAPRDDFYKILWQNGKKQTYRYMATGFVFTSRRVEDGFEMPGCEAIS